MLNRKECQLSIRQWQSSKGNINEILRVFPSHFMFSVTEESSSWVLKNATLTERTMEDPEYKKTWAHLTPIGSAAYPSDIAQTALFLVSEQARHITGQTIVVDGGWSAVSPSPF